MGRGAATAGLVQELRWLDPVGASATCGEATTAGKIQRRYREGGKEIEGEEKARGEGHGLLVMLDGDEVRDGDAGVERSARAEEERCRGLANCCCCCGSEARKAGRGAPAGCPWQCRGRGWPVDSGPSTGMGQTRTKEVGAGDGAGTAPFEGGLGGVDHLESPEARLVRGRVALSRAVGGHEQHGGVAALHEAVVEVHPEERPGEAGRQGQRPHHLPPHDVLHAGARLAVELVVQLRPPARRRHRREQQRHHRRSPGRHLLGQEACFFLGYARNDDG